MDKRYQASQIERYLQEMWEAEGVYHYDPNSTGKVYSIDTPPPTVSGKLHLGHVYSYSHADFMARYFRMQGRNVFYPMGFDDNGLPTEHLVEKKLGKTAQEMGRQAFIDACLRTSVEEEHAYENLWRRLGLSIDWRHTYRTIDAHARRVSQWSFIDLYQQGHLYRQEAPIIWCPGCQTALAQSDLTDIERKNEFVTLRFDLLRGGYLPIATTRPELLPACVAVFVHPEDPRFKDYVGQRIIVPVFGQEVPILKDPAADPEKGTGAVMCCTFGDQTDIDWWRTYHLPLVEAIDSAGKMTSVAGELQGMPVNSARQAIKTTLENSGYLLDRSMTNQVVRAHDRDDIPVEFLTTKQWFLKILDKKAEWLKLGNELNWHPETMIYRYQSWVENLNWDWCISRQRYYGVPIPAWYCADCGQVLLPSSERLPVDPLIDAPDGPCQSCGSTAYMPEQDVLDTWPTSSLSPQIAAGWLSDENLFKQLFPLTLRPQAHEIIRTWTFYTIVKSHFHFNQLPWQEVLISGWGIAGEGMGKISKSRGGGPMPPLEMLEKYSADAVRYWAASTGTGKDAVISEEKVILGQKCVTKLWNLARFSARFIGDGVVSCDWDQLSAGDRWILSKSEHLIRQATEAMDRYEYAFAKNETEKFMWIFADNYLEMAKGRLYAEDEVLKQAAKFTLARVLLIILKLFAPFLPHVTEQIYLNLFNEGGGYSSIHRSAWPKSNQAYFNRRYLEFGEVLITIASSVRRYKSDHGLSLGTTLEKLQIKIADSNQKSLLEEAIPDLQSITRAKLIEVVDFLNYEFDRLEPDEFDVEVALSFGESNMV